MPTRSSFLASPIHMVTSSVYLLRRGLFQAIQELATDIGGSVLDFGCGSKPYESIFVNATSYVGVDIEVSGHDHLTSKVDVFYDGKSLPFADDSFDAVVSFEVFEHVFNPVEVLAEIYRVTKPGGHLLISTPFAWDEHEVPYDFARYTSFGVRHLLESAGFKVIHTRKTTTSFVAISQLFIAYLKQHVFPRNIWLSRFLQVTTIFPLTALSLLLNAILPKRYELFSNCVALAAKPPASQVVANPSPRRPT